MKNKMKKIKQSITQKKPALLKNPGKVLITGGAGFIGSNLAKFYLDQGSEVTVYDNLSRPGVEKNLEWLKKTVSQKGSHNKLTIIIADLLNVKKLNQAVIDQQLILHQAGQTAVTTSLIKPMEDFQVNAYGSLLLLEAVRNNAPKAVSIFASTNKVYGDLESWKLKESESRYMPLHKQSVDESQLLSFHSPYGCSKGAADQYFLDYARSYGLKTVVFRQSCIYGEHQLGVVDQGWLAFFALQAIHGKPITIFGNGKQVRDVLHIQDLVNAYHQVWLLQEKQEKVIGQVFNIGGGVKNNLSLLEALQLISKIIGSEIEFSFDQPRVGDQKYYVSDIAKARKVLGWQPTVSLKDGLKKLISWLRDNC